MRTDNELSIDDQRTLCRLHTCVYDLNAALAAAHGANFTVGVEVSTNTAGVETVKVDVLRRYPYPPDEVSVAIEEER